MNREETLARYKMGREEWNKWAKQMLAKRERINGRSSEFEAKYDATTRVKLIRWQEQAKADFSEVEFYERFEGEALIFPGPVRFFKTVFADEAVFTGSQFWETAQLSLAQFQGNAWFRDAQFMRTADFRGAKFLGSAKLNSAQYMESAWFDGAEFEEDANFSCARFQGESTFGSARFRRDARFQSAQFGGGAWFFDVQFLDLVSFLQAQFQGQARFDRTQFRGNAVFELADFAGFSSFEYAKFGSNAIFAATRAASAFTLNNAQFQNVPNFVQASFAEALRLDNLRLQPQGFWGPSLSQVKDKNSKKESGPELAARWRALKRLAIQGHDHTREQEFFAGEVKARRGSEDPVTSSTYWAGWAYQLLSNFGRSPAPSSP